VALTTRPHNAEAFVACSRVNFTFTFITGRGQAVAHLVEALRYKPEVRGFDSRWCNWNILLL
jgi:hypothetical protein